MSTKNRVESHESIDNDVVDLGDTAMVPYNPPAGGMVPYNPLGKVGQYHTNIDTSTQDGKLLMMKCRKNADKAVSDVLGQEFALTQFFLHPAEDVDDKTGEVSQWIRIVLIDADGVTVSCGSQGILRDLADIVSLWGPGPWATPIVVKFIQTNTGKKRRLFGLEIVGCPEFASKGGRRGK